jgi:hypothetical protein
MTDTWEVSVRRRLFAIVVAVCLYLCAAHAAERATFVLTDGERVSGSLAFHITTRESLVDNDFSLSVTPGQPNRLLHYDQVAVIDFVGGTPEIGELDALPDNGHLLAMRDGATKRGHFVNIIGGDTVKWQDDGGRPRDLPTREIARIYLQPESARRIFNYQRPITPVGAQNPPGVPQRGHDRVFSVVGSDVTVEAKAAWTDTGLDVIRGDQLRFDARGEVTRLHAPNAVVGPAGTLDAKSQKSPLPSQPLGALIGKIGTTGTPFAVGADHGVRAMPATGRLMLGVNDDVVGDNSGAFQVTIRLGR